MTSQILNGCFGTSRALAGRGLCSSLLVLVLGAVPAGAATISVDGTTCTLDNAIASANDDAAFGGCSDGNGADTLSLTQDILLTAGIINNIINTSDVTLEGNSFIIDGGGQRCLTVDSGGMLTVQNVTITNCSRGSNGGAIYNNGTLMVTNSKFVGNQTTGLGTPGGAISNEGTLTVLNSTFEANAASSSGGAIANYATLTARYNLFQGNSANLFGGGIGNEGPATIDSNTFFNNISSSAGGAIYTSTLPGITSRVENNTIYENLTATTGGGIHSQSGIVIMNYNTITQNWSNANSGAGVYIISTSTSSNNTLNGNLIAGNVSSAATGREVFRIGNSGTFNRNYNLLGHNGETITQAISGYTTVANEICATSNKSGSCVHNPQPLSNILQDGLPPDWNGGPTPTVALVAGSPAIDHIPTSSTTPVCVASSTKDQRGYFRANSNLSNYPGFPPGNTRTPDDPVAYKNQACDIGAYEFTAKVTSKNMVSASALVKQGSTQLCSSSACSSYPLVTYGIATYRLTFTNNSPSSNLHNVVLKLNALCSYPTNSSTTCTIANYLLDTDTTTQGGIGSTLSGANLTQFGSTNPWAAGTSFYQDFKIGFNAGTKWRFFIDLYADPAQAEPMSVSNREQGPLGRFQFEVDEDGAVQQIYGNSHQSVRSSEYENFWFPIR